MDSFYKKLAIESAMSLIVIGALASGLIFFSDKIVSYSDQVASMRKNLSDKSIALNSLAKLRLDYNDSVKKYFNVIYNVLPQRDRLINLSKDFQLLASQNSLAYTFAFAGENKASGGMPGSISFKVSAAGDFDKILKFIKSLESFHYLSTLDNFSIAREDVKTQLALTGKIFFR